MNVLDENIPESQWVLLHSWRIRVRQIGRDVGRAGMQDEEVLAWLRQRRGITFFTRDAQFYRPALRHQRYRLICLVIGHDEVATFVRRVPCHPALRTATARMGSAVRVTHAGLRVWRWHAEIEVPLGWPR